MSRPSHTAAGALALLVLAVGLAFGGLTSRFGMPSRDHVDFYLRVQQYDAELAEGHWPQLLPDAVRGGGHAFPRFYPPVAHAAAAIAYPLTGDVVLASHLSMLAGVLLSAITMFALLRGLGAGALPAGLGALVYCLFPYRATQIYVRGAFAEGWAMAWYPLVTLGLVRTARDGRAPWWWPLTVAATILSHTATSLWALPAIGGATLLAAPRAGLAAWRSLTTGAVLALGLAAFSLVPVAWYVGGVRAGDPATMEATAEAVGSYAAAWDRVWLIAIMEVVIVAAAIALLRRAKGDLTGRLLASALLAHAVLIAMGAAPAAVWGLVPQPWRYVQFGWRLMAPATYFAALGFGLLAARFSTPIGRAVVAAAAAILAIGGLVQLRREGGHDPALTHAALLPWIRGEYGEFGLTIGGDYLPRDADPAALAGRVAKTRDRLLATGSLTVDTHGRPTGVRTGGATEVALPLVAYDAFRVTDERSRELATRSKQGQLVAMAGSTVEEVRISRRLPPVVAAGMAISLASLVLVGIGAGRGRGSGARRGDASITG
jgi:hypothetical protein